MRGDPGAEQNKLSLEEQDTQPSVVTQMGPRVLLDPLPIAAQAALVPAPSCMCELQPLPVWGIAASVGDRIPAQGIRQQGVHGTRAALGAPRP